MAKTKAKSKNTKTKGKGDAIAGMTRERFEQKLKDWKQGELADFIARQPEAKSEYKTASGLPLKRVYTALDKGDGADDIGLPGQYPFTRGPYPTMYRGRLWTMRQIAGFGTAEDTNQRFKYLLSQGTTGLSTDFDMPTLMGYDSDHPMSRGEVGREGAAVDTLADMEALFDGIDLTKISVSMTINPTAWILMGGSFHVLLSSQMATLDGYSGNIALRCQRGSTRHVNTFKKHQAIALMRVVPVIHLRVTKQSWKLGIIAKTSVLNIAYVIKSDGRGDIPSQESP